MPEYTGGPIGIPQWSIDYWNKKRNKLDLIIDELKQGRRAAPVMMHTWFDRIILRLELFEEEEL